MDVRALIEEFNAAWSRGDPAAMSGCLAEDVSYCPNAWDGPAGTVRGRAAVVAVLAGQTGAGEGPALGAVWAADDRAVCEWAWPPAEDGTVLRGLDVYRVRDGRIVAKDVFGKITS
ncbi:nuclear transport factor 2 family protein [Micromonospora maritima]|uniref:Nuclear transport factor 2 family protein n=1 Tax=Micromonospora maritima TaxID=986711 RepID=A0ABW7ZRY4_9ACTN